MTDFVCQVDDEESVIREAKALQLAQGVEPLVVTVTPNLYDGPIQVVEYEPQILQDIWASFSDEEKLGFVRRYGSIFDLLYVSFPGAMIRELLNHWDPNFHCFTFNDVDISPLPEEYQSILRLSNGHSTKAYVQNPKTKVGKALSEILKMKKEKLVVEIQEIEGVNYLPINFLLGYICKGSSSRDLKIRAFALILYGVVLFPKISGFVDEYAIKVFERELHGVNPTFAIISETFAAMDKCYLESEMTMYGSTSLLVIWIFGHLRPSPVMGIPYARYSMAFDMSTSTIREFIEARGEYLKTTREQWREYFSRLDGKSINWRATWMPIMNILYRCGSNFWVSLLGPRGCIGYAPSMFRRQVECWQFIPPIRGMRESNFRYSDADCWGKFQRAVSSWKSPRKIRHSLIYRETLAVQDRVANDYPAWQQKRAKMPAQIFYDRNCKRK
ncbi:hypothetical protein LINPERPRIM_LOCUS18844, partial [Linum perenne]